MMALLSLTALLLLTGHSLAADCSVIVDTLARLKCYDQAADAKLPMPKGAATDKRESTEKRIRKMGGRPTQ
jgi:hypothetical protein